MILLTDRCCDIQAERLQELQIDALGLMYQVNGVEAQEDATTDYKVFYNQLREGAMTSTSQINAADFIDFFTPYLEKGEEVIYLGFTSGLSGTFQSATIAAETLKETFPNAKLTVIDTLCASLGQGLLVYLTYKKIQEGLSYDEVIAFVENTKMKINHWVTVNDLHYLRRGGRLSGSTAVIGTLLDIKPIIKVNDEGKLISVDKKKGRRKALKHLVGKFEQGAVDRSVAFICHSDCLEDAETVKAELLKLNPDMEVYIHYIGTVIGSHTGVGTIAVFFVGEHR